MKRKLSTVVLFVLLIMTVVALVKLDKAEARNASLHTTKGTQYGTN